METALVTGMFETSFLPEKQVGLDVKNEKTGSFSEILESSLKNNDVVGNEIKDYKTEQDVSSETIDTEEEKLETEQKKNDEENTKDVNNIIEEFLGGIKESEGKPKKKDKKIKEEVLINDLVQQSDLAKLMKKEDIKEQEVEIKIEDVKIEKEDDSKLVGSIKNGEIELTPEEKLDDLLSKLDVKLIENVKTKDESEKVIEVGPQSVETEKITLNIKDVDEKKDVESLEALLHSAEEKEVDKLKDVNELVQNEIEDVNGFEKGDFKNEFSEQTEKQNKTEVENVGNESFMSQDVANNSASDKKGFEEDKGFPKQKEDRFKIKDFRSKEDVDAMQKFIKEESIKLEDNLEIKDVNNINKFQDIDVNEMDILDQVTEKLEVSLFDNKSEMVIKLKPNDLGNVTVKITIENGVMNAKFLAESTKVKEALESNLNNLKESLKDQGLNVQDLNVSVDSGRSQNHNFNQNNLVYLNDKKGYQANKAVSYGDSYYESVNDERKENHYWMDSTVSFLA